MTGTIVYGPSAAETSWQDARDKVRADLWRPSSSAIPDDVVDRALHSALLDLEAERRWLWLENITGTLTMPTEADNLALPASVKSVTSLAFKGGSTDTLVYDILQEMRIAQVRQLARGGTVGDPTYYARSDMQLYFDCPVAESDAFELVFTSTCPRYLDLAIATPPVTLTLQTPAVVALAAHYVALTYLKNESEAARQAAAYNRILERLFVEEDTARADGQMGGRIQADDAHYRAAHGYEGQYG